MSETSSEVARRWEDRPVGHGLLALWVYVAAYDVSTVVWEFAEPATHALVWPALGVGGVVSLAEVSQRVPRPVLNLGGSFLLPVLATVVAIVLTA